MSGNNIKCWKDQQQSSVSVRIPWVALLVLLAGPATHANTTDAEAAASPIDDDATPFVIDERLERPESLEPAINFWRRVYTEIDASEGFIHDDRHMDIVYEVIDLPEGSVRRQRQLANTAQTRLRQRLTRLAGGKGAQDDEDRRILALWKDRPEALAGAAGRLRFQRGTAGRFRAGLARSGRWLPHIEAALRRAEVPVELAALPHVESSFNPIARSHVGASGMWQFTSGTGKRFMRIDHVVDERLDPFIASEAAASLLSSDYREVGSWPLAITAYNHGANGMARAVAKLGTNDIGEIVQRYHSRTFGFSSRNFYAGFLAAVDVHHDSERYFGEIPREPREIPQRVKLSGWYGATDLARTAGVPLDELRALNPALLNSVWSGTKLVPRSFALRLPGETPIDTFEKRLAELLDMGAQRADEMHIVRSGEALSTIARKYRVSVREIMALNGISNANRIRAGARLRLPVDPSTSRSRTAQVASRTSGSGADTSRRPLTHRVARGESIWTIAKRYGISGQELVTVNGLSDPDRLALGQSLKLPGAEQKAGPEIHRVRSGDSLSGIAARYGVSERHLAALNGIRNPDRLAIGTVLRLRADG